MPRPDGGAGSGPIFALYDDRALVNLPGGRQLLARPAGNGGALVFEGATDPGAAVEVEDLLAPVRYESVRVFNDWAAALDYCWGRIAPAAAVNPDRPRPVLAG